MQTNFQYNQYMQQNNNASSNSISSTMNRSHKSLSASQKADVHVGDVVYGRLSKHFKSPGTIVDIDGGGKSATYVIKWRDGGENTECKRRGFWSELEHRQSINDPKPFEVPTLKDSTMLLEQQRQQQLLLIQQQQQQQQQLHRPVASIVSSAQRIPTARNVYDQQIPMGMQPSHLNLQPLLPIVPTISQSSLNTTFGNTMKPFTSHQQNLELMGTNLMATMSSLNQESVFDDDEHRHKSRRLDPQNGSEPINQTVLAASLPIAVSNNTNNHSSTLHNNNIQHFMAYYKEQGGFPDNTSNNNNSVSNSQQSQPLFSSQPPTHEETLQQNDQRNSTAGSAAVSAPSAGLSLSIPFPPTYHEQAFHHQSHNDQQQPLAEHPPSGGQLENQHSLLLQHPYFTTADEFSPPGSSNSGSHSHNSSRHHARSLLPASLHTPRDMSTSTPHYNNNNNSNNSSNNNTGVTHNITASVNSGASSHLPSAHVAQSGFEASSSQLTHSSGTDVIANTSSNSSNADTINANNNAMQETAHVALNSSHSIDSAEQTPQHLLYQNQQQQQFTTTNATKPGGYNNNNSNNSNNNTAGSNNLHELQQEGFPTGTTVSHPAMSSTPAYLNQTAGGVRPPFLLSTTQQPLLSHISHNLYHNNGHNHQQSQRENSAVETPQPQSALLALQKLQQQEQLNYKPPMNSNNRHILAAMNHNSSRDTSSSSSTAYNNNSNNNNTNSNHNSSNSSIVMNAANVPDAAAAQVLSAMSSSNSTHINMNTSSTSNAGHYAGNINNLNAYNINNLNNTNNSNSNEEIMGLSNTAMILARAHIFHNHQSTAAMNTTSGTNTNSTANNNVNNSVINQTQHASQYNPSEEQIAPYHILLPINKLSQEVRGRRVMRRPNHHNQTTNLALANNNNNNHPMVNDDEEYFDHNHDMNNTGNPQLSSLPTAAKASNPCRYLCKICRSFKASHYCARCSRFHTEEKLVMSICEPATGRDCLIQHLRKCNVPEGQN